MESWRHGAILLSGPADLAVAAPERQSPPAVHLRHPAQEAERNGCCSVLLLCSSSHMVDDDEKITMIDFPQMVSVSHRNAQMFFDRDVECIYKFFNKRFNLSSEKGEEQDGSETDDDESGRPSFLSVQKAAGSLDKELAASGFTRKEQVEMEKFIEENAEEHDSSSDYDDDLTSKGDSEGGDAVSVKISSLKIADQGSAGVSDCTLAARDEPESFSEEHETSTSHSGQNKLRNPPTDCNGDAKESLESGGNDDGSSEDPDDGDDAVLARQLNKQRKRAIAAAHGAAAHGRRRPLSSRNAYKDKGKGTMNSKIQRQSCKW